MTHIRDLLATRRALLGGLAGLPLLNLAGCASPNAPGTATADLGFASVAPTKADRVSVPLGYTVRTLIAWGDPLVEGLTPFDPDALTRTEQEQRFGQNNDMLALFPAQYAFPWQKDQDRLILCANNEYASLPLMFPAVRRPEDFTPAQVETMMAAIGVSVVVLERVDGAWRPVRDAAPGAGLNRRITPFTPMVFSGPAANHPWIRAAGAFVNAREPGRPYEPNPEGAIACGTMANCAGGLTPWGTYLTSEENFQDEHCITDPTAVAFVEAKRDPVYEADLRRFGIPSRYTVEGLPVQYDLSQNPHQPALYGWVVEIDPYDPSWAPRKRTAIGRKKGECATTALTRDGRVALYRGDDEANQFVYKFVSNGRFNPNDRVSSRDLLDDGVLYVAKLHADGSGEWVALTLDAANTAARAANAPLFRDAGDVMVRVREAAALLGATQMDRPEDVEALRGDDWVGQGPVLVVCTKNSSSTPAHPGSPRRDGALTNATGQILRFDEDGGDCGALTFRWDVFLLAGDPLVDDPAHPAYAAAGGAQPFRGDRFACPDNIFLDSRLNAWITTDGGDDVFDDCNDCVVVTSATGEGARIVKRFMVAPPGAEICGPLMTPDERAFLGAVQHPGSADDFERTRWSGAEPPSRFPDGGWPRSAVVIVTRDDGGRIGD